MLMTPHGELSVVESAVALGENREETSSMAHHVGSVGSR
jgi:hypothetical protein